MTPPSITASTIGIGIISIFERKPWSYVRINGGYLTVALTVNGPFTRRMDAEWLNSARTAPSVKA